MKYYLILLTIFLTLFSVSDLGVSLTYGDYTAILILILFFNDLIRGEYFLNKFSNYWLYYIIILFISSVINFTWLEGRFLNIFKTNLFSLVFFVIVYNLIIKNKLSAKSYLLGLTVLCITFLVKTWPEMQSAWAETEFTNVNIFESSLNLNTWGFSLILFLLVTLYGWSMKIVPKVSLISSIVLIVFIFFSYSRTAYSLTLLTVIWSVFYVNKSNIKNLIFPIIALSLIFVFRNQLNVFGFQISDAALNFFDKKAGGFGNDLINTRFYMINIEPILENFNSFNPLQMLIGDGVSVQHSFISHSLVMTGLIGFIYYTLRFWYAIKLSFRLILSNKKIIDSKYLLLAIIVVLINDFITNISAFLPFSAYLSAIIIAFFFANLNLKENKVYDTKNSN